MTTWQDPLKKSFEQRKKEDKRQKQMIEEAQKEFTKFKENIIRPAFEEFAEELKKYGREAKISIIGNYTSIAIGKLDQFGGFDENFIYYIKLEGTTLQAGIEAFNKEGKRYRTFGSVKSGSSEDNRPKNISKEDILHQLAKECSLFLKS